MRFASLAFVVAAATFATASLAPAQTPTPSPSPSPSATPAKHHAPKKAPSPTPSVEGGTVPAGEAAAMPSGQTAGGPVAAVAPPLTPRKSMAKATPAPGGGPGLVWVNTKSHVYHQPSSRYYGKTKEGKYLSEEAAKAEGDKPAPHGD